MKKLLWPPLPFIEKSLFALSDELLLRWANNDASLDKVTIENLNNNDDAKKFKQLLEESNNDYHKMNLTEQQNCSDETAPVPNAIQQLFKRRIESQNAQFSDESVSGQIIQISQCSHRETDDIFNFPRPLAVLLLDPLPDELLLPVGRGKIWHGFLVSDEVNYASYWDILLEEDDGPCDPLAGMIQIWNPVHVYLPDTGRVLAALSQTRLQAIRATMNEYINGEDTKPQDADPGRLGVRLTFDHFNILCGTPLSGKSDPRWQYQAIYHEAANAIRTTAQQWQTDIFEENIVFPDNLLDQLTGTVKQLVTTLINTFDDLLLVPPVEHAMGSKEQYFCLQMQSVDLFLKEIPDEQMILIQFVCRTGESCEIIQPNRHGENSYQLNDDNKKVSLYLPYNDFRLTIKCGNNPPKMIG
jgi:hypothetical protein